MSGRHIRFLGAGLALASAGVYLFVYLYRWEWHRAILAASFVVIAEVALLGALLLDRVRAVERKLDTLADAALLDERERIGTRVHEAAPESSSPFAWLEADRMGVFVPVLLGAGVVLSVVAWAVERAAQITAGSALERSLARSLQPLAVPAGTLLTGWEAPPPRAQRRAARRIVGVTAAVGMLLVVGLGLDLIADATQNRGDQIQANTAATVSLQVSTVRRGLSDQRVADHLWGACAPQLGSRYELVDVTALGGGRILLTVTPEIGTYAERRFRGCIQDSGADLVLARITSISPAG